MGSGSHLFFIRDSIDRTFALLRNLPCLEITGDADRQSGKVVARSRRERELVATSFERADLLSDKTEVIDAAFRS